MGHSVLALKAVDGTNINSCSDLFEWVHTQYLHGPHGGDPQYVWFRGQEDASWDVVASIWRGFENDFLGNDSRNHEQNLTNRFRARASLRLSNPPVPTAFSAWLSIMQHHGLPTRLVDWSSSPLVAAFFAVYKSIYEEKSLCISRPAAIWALFPHELNKLRLNDYLTYPMDANTLEIYLRPAFKGSDTNEKTIVAAMAVEHDLRMFSQQGNFTIHSDRAPINWQNDCGKYLRVAYIPMQSVRRIAVELRMLGIRKGDVYPDLDNLAAELKNFG